MKARELRIGNQTTLQGQKCIIDGSYIKWMEDGTYMGHEPIPLTEEWFLDNGEIDENGNPYFQYPEVESLRFYLVKGFIQLTQSFHAPMFNFEHITKVHQFQNLYFAMNGRELMIK